MARNSISLSAATGDLHTSVFQFLSSRKTLHVVILSGSLSTKGRCLDATVTHSITKRNRKDATAVCVHRQNPSLVRLRSYCVLSATFMSFSFRVTKWKRVMLSEAKRCGQSSVARGRCAERRELLYPFRCRIVAVGVDFSRRPNCCNEFGPMSIHAP